MPRAFGDGAFGEGQFGGGSITVTGPTTGPVSGLFDNGFVELYGHRFRVTPDPIQESLVSVFPGKIVIGDNRRADDPIASSYVMQDWTGGGLKRWMDPTVDFDRFYFGNCATWFNRQLTLNSLVRLVDPPSWGDSFSRDIRAGVTFNDIQYLGWDDRLTYVDPSETVVNVGTVGSHALVITDMQVYRILTGGSSGQSRIIIAYRDSGSGATGYATSDGATISAGSGTMAAMTIWDGKLVRCTDAGVLQFTTDLSTWLSLPGQSTVPLTQGSVTSMNVYPDGMWGLDEIQIATTVGLFWYDEIAQTVRASRFMGLPPAPNSGRPLVNHKSNLYIPIPSNQVLRYTTDTVTPEGMDQDDGVPANYRGQISWLGSTLNFLVASTMSAGNLVSTGLMAGDEITYASTMMGTQGYSTIYIQTKIGGKWHILYQSDLANTALYWVGAGTAGSRYRLFFGINGRLGVIDLYSDLINPLDNTIQEFAATGFHVTPWNEMGWSEIQKQAIRQKFGVKGDGLVAGGATCTTTVRSQCSITVEYGLDYDETNWYPLTTITTGTPPTANYGISHSGLSFKAIRFRYTLNRCDNTHHTPVLVWSTLTFLKQMDARWGYRMTLDLTTDSQGITPADQADFLRRMCDPNDLGNSLGDFRGWVNGKFIARKVAVSELVGKVKGGNKQSGIYSVALVAFP